MQPAGQTLHTTDTVWSATVVEHHRLRHDVAVVRLECDDAMVPFAPGQYVDVTVPQHPRLPRRLSPALPPSLDGKLEFHVRTVPGGWVSGSIVTATRPGDVWTIGAPQGGNLHVDDSGRIVIMVAGGTGLAPLRALILDVARRPDPPQTFLFVGGRTPRDLYAADMLILLAETLPWLTVVPVVESVDDPGIPDEWYDRIVAHVGDPGFHPDELLEGSLDEVVTSYGAFGDHQVLVCGSAAMVRATLHTLVETGTPAENVRCDPY
ncbi:FAD-binding oxidoreductase [Rhodococcus aetherivorans]|uniref:FAD-binding oxidoreductase n=1 Tax=Rhodococcus aetherivorans TaxID=191292 RepID=UPI00045C5218|nr:FAD-binding oxidoreductase [Rhodococcus aetherivorans]AKE91273.1 oxidoreductase [Rhodococcus aetherivorans]KDE12206.1 oxidoreductase [Rhodococcus aetherivorans]